MNYELTGRAGLLEILSWARPPDSATERAFCREYLDRIPGMRSDAFGHRMITIGGRPRTLWRCHLDTVAAAGAASALDSDAHGVAPLCHAQPGMSLVSHAGAEKWSTFDAGT